MLVWAVWRRPRREWNPVKLQLEAHKVRQGHRRSCGSCGGCQTNIMLALARFSAMLLTYYFIPRSHQNWSQKVSNSKFPGVEYAPDPPFQLSHFVHLYTENCSLQGNESCSIILKLFLLQFHTTLCPWIQTTMQTGSFQYISTKLD